MSLHSALSQSNPDCSHSGVIQFAGLTGALSLPVHHVFYVVSLRAGLQMLRVYAKADIAFMSNDGASDVLLAKPVGQPEGTAMRSFLVGCAVPVVGRPSRVQNAIFHSKPRGTLEMPYGLLPALATAVSKQSVQVSQARLERGQFRKYPPVQGQMSGTGQHQCKHHPCEEGIEHEADLCASIEEVRRALGF